MAKKLIQSKKIIKTVKYIITHEHFSDGTYREKRENDGFDGLELLGLITRIQLEINQQLSGAMKQPTEKKRINIVDKK